MKSLSDWWGWTWVVIVSGILGLWLVALLVNSPLLVSWAVRGTVTLVPFTLMGILVACIEGAVKNTGGPKQ